MASEHCRVGLILSYLWCWSRIISGSCGERKTSPVQVDWR